MLSKIHGTSPSSARDVVDPCRKVPKQIIPLVGHLLEQPLYLLVGFAVGDFAIESSILLY